MLNSHPHLRIPAAVAAILLAVLTVASCDSADRRAAMLAVLDQTDSLNRNYILITTDSLIREAADYFDSHGTPNERVRAHYLLGCAYRDMGEAPRAIEAWQDAIACADTTAADCDYKSLGKAYSQMANLFHRQLLLSDEINARKQAYYYTCLTGDTLVAIHEYKMLSNPYLIQNKSDSAEVILKRALYLYDKYGYLQEELIASIMLMHIYAEQSFDLSALKDLIDRFEAECTAFDENRDLPPSRRLYYYYKGRYYEFVNQLDSAELCYRKIFFPNMAYVNKDHMYRGLLSVFQKRHDPDSISKYAALFTEANDSSIAIKDQELTAQMAASYDYNRYKRLAFDNVQKANKRLYFAIILLTFVIICVTVALFFRWKYQKKQEALVLLQREYVETQDYLNKLKEQLQKLGEDHRKVLISLQKESAESQTVVAILNTQHEAEKGHILNELQSYADRVKQLERELKISHFSKASKLFLNLGIVRRIKIYAGDGQRKLSDNDLRLYADAVGEHYPDLITDLDGNSTITPLAKKVCMLTILNLKPGEIVNLLGISSSQVSNLRKDVNAALFNEKTTRTLYKNLSKRYMFYSS